MHLELGDVRGGGGMGRVCGVVGLWIRLRRGGLARWGLVAEVEAGC